MYYFGQRQGPKAYTVYGINATTELMNILTLLRTISFTSIDAKVIISYPTFGYPTELDSLAQIIPSVIIRRESGSVALSVGCQWTKNYF